MLLGFIAGVLGSLLFFLIFFLRLYLFRHLRIHQLGPYGIEHYPTAYAPIGLAIGRFIWKSGIGKLLASGPESSGIGETIYLMQFVNGIIGAIFLVPATTLGGLIGTVIFRRRQPAMTHANQ